MAQLFLDMRPMNIYLASKSPRRRQLLEQIGMDFDLLLVDTPEIIAPNEIAEDYSLRVTSEKLVAAEAKMLEEQLPIRPILCADTEVVLDGTIMGKPQDKQDAFAMLKSFSGRSHQVITSVGVIFKDYQKVVLQETIVSFAELSDEAINQYLSTDNYKDKSGSYGIQSAIGQYIRSINGCFFSVMGLPLNAVRELLFDLQRIYPNC